MAKVMGPTGAVCLSVLAMAVHGLGNPARSAELEVSLIGVPSADSAGQPPAKLNDDVYPPLPYVANPPWIYPSPTGESGQYTAMSFFTDHGSAARWIAYDLGAEYDVTRCVLLPYVSTTGLAHYYPIDYEIQKSDDGVDWETIVGVQGNSHPLIEHAFASPVRTAHVRLYVTSAARWGGGFRLGATEFQVYAVPEPAAMWLLALGGLGLIRRRRR